MAYTIYNAVSLQGGGTRSLDALSVGDLNNEDRAIVFDLGKVYFFEFDSTSTEAETVAAHPFKIRPDDYASAGVWIEQESDYNEWDLDPIPATSWADISGAWATTNVPAVVGDVWTDEGNYTSWNEHSVWLAGVEYTIAAGNSSAQAGVDDHIVYWVVGDSAYTVSATPPEISTRHYIVATVTDAGVAIPVWTAFQNAVIGNAYVVNLAADKIQAGTVLTSGVYIGDGLYGDGTDVDSLQPSDAGATAGATWGSNIGNEPTDLSDINSAEGTKLSGIESGATAGADWDVNLTNTPERVSYDSAAELSGKPQGLYLCADYMGYWDGSSSFDAYIRSNGHFSFGGDSNNFITWNGSILTIATDERKTQTPPKRPMYGRR